MMTFKTIPIATLHKLLICDPIAGKLYWKTRGEEMFVGKKWSPTHAAANWNARLAGKEALGYIGIQGYKVGKVDGVDLRAHRVIFAMTTGAWPTDEIDHDQGVRSHNQFEKLNPATHAQNCKNQKRFNTNKSGTTGVCYDKKSGKWRAYIVVDYKQKSLGYFFAKKEAIAARKVAAAEYGFHQNHGREGILITDKAVTIQ